MLCVFIYSSFVVQVKSYAIDNGLDPKEIKTQ